MPRNMENEWIHTLVLVLLICLFLGIVRGQEKNAAKVEKPKAKWEQAGPEEARRVLEQHPELLSSDSPYAELIARASKVGMVGFWKEELRHPDSRVRERALELSTPEVLSAETVIPAILPLLNDKSALVRFEAAAALLRFGNEQGIGTLIALVKDPGGSFPSKAVDLLVRHRRKEAVPVFREVFEEALNQLSKGKDSAYPAHFAHYLAKGMAALEDRESYHLFARYFHIRFAVGPQLVDFGVVEAAGRLADPRLEESLRAIFGQSKELRTRLAAAFGLARLGDASGTAFLMHYAGQLRGVPDSTRYQVDVEGNRRGVENPAYSRWKEGKPPLHELISAVLYLGELKVSQAVQLLLELTSVENEAVIEPAIKSLALLGDNRAVPVLVKLTSRESQIRHSAAYALLFFDHPEASKAIDRVFTNETERANLIREAKELGPAQFLRPSA